MDAWKIKEETLQQQVNALRQKCSASEGIVQSLEDEVKRQCERFQQRLDQQSSIHQSEVTDLQCQIKVLQQGREDLLGEVSRSAQKLVMKENEALAARKEVHELKKQVLESKKALEDALRQFNPADTSSLMRDNRQLLESSDTKALQAEITALKRALEIQGVELKEYEKQKKHLTA